jgi:GNAT superfamily N-acetyltransferase
MKLEFKLIYKKNLRESEKKVFAQLLKKQGKVGGDLNSKADRCKFICIATKDGIPISIGGIKKKTKSDFNSEKANIAELESEFEWELGYLFTDENYNKQGIGSFLVKLLINEYGNNNLMASTEVSKNPAMIRILEKNGFKQYGEPWKSGIHSDYLGLFLKFC